MIFRMEGKGDETVVIECDDDNIDEKIPLSHAA
jgi:hypothetical protein